MNHFTTRLICLLLLCGLFGGYQAFATISTQNAEIDALKTAMEEQKNASGGSASAGGASSAYKDGKYQGTATGYGGPVTVEVTMKGGAIEGIEIVSAAGEDEAYWNMAISVKDAIIQQQTTDVDAVSGATFSSNGIKNAVADAVGKAAK